MGREVTTASISKDLKSEINSYEGSNFDARLKNWAVDQVPESSKGLTQRQKEEVETMIEEAARGY